MALTGNEGAAPLTRAWLWLLALTCRGREEVVHSLIVDLQVAGAERVRGIIPLLDLRPQRPMRNDNRVKEGLRSRVLSMCLSKARGPFGCLWRNRWRLLLRKVRGSAKGAAMPPLGQAVKTRRAHLAVQVVHGLGDDAILGVALVAVLADDLLPA